VTRTFIAREEAKREKEDVEDEVLGLEEPA
jgi:hypothetical protein